MDETGTHPQPSNGEPAATARPEGTRVRRRGPVSTELERRCADRGLRLTAQRRVIARVLAEAGDHPDVESLYRRCLAQNPQIALSTLYRTLKLFADQGLIERHAFNDGRSRYERHSEGHHDHLIDVATGRVIEFHSEEIEQLQRAVAARLGYRLVGHRLELYAVRDTGERS